MLPDYGLEDLTGAALEDDGDVFNDDTFGDGLGDEWNQGNETALAKLHEDFLAGDLKMDAGMESGGFFGGLGGPMDGALEDEPSFDAPLPPDFDIAPYPAASSSSS